jgi:Uncharacterized conserved protein (DUF2190)
MTRQGGRKIREPNSVEVALPEGTTVDQGEFVERDNWFGLVNFSNKADARGKIVFNTEIARYATSQLAEGAQFRTGEPISFDEATRLFTTGAAAPVGMVTEDGPDAAGVVEFIGGGLVAMIVKLAQAGGGA